MRYLALIFIILFTYLNILNAYEDDEQIIDNAQLEEQLKNQGFSIDIFEKYNNLDKLIKKNEKPSEKKEEDKEKKKPVKFVEIKKKPFDSGNFEKVTEKEKKSYKNSADVLDKVKKGFYFKPQKRIIVPGVNVYGNSGMIKTTNAYTLKKGEFFLTMHLLYHNVKNDDKGETIKFASHEHADITKFPIIATFGLLDNLELSCNLPISNFNVDVKQIDSNTLKENGIGDINFRLKFQLPLREDNEDTKFAAGLGIKFPTGKEGEKFGSTGQTDVEVFTALSQRMGVLTANAELGFIFMGDPDSNPVEINNNKFIYNFGFSFGRNEKIEFMTEINGEEWGDYGGKIDFTPGIRAIINQNFLVNIGLPISLVNNQRFGYSFQLVFGGGFKF